MLLKDIDEKNWVILFYPTAQHILDQVYLRQQLMIIDISSRWRENNKLNKCTVGIVWSPNISTARRLQVLVAATKTMAEELKQCFIYYTSYLFYIW